MNDREAVERIIVENLQNEDVRKMTRLDLVAAILAYGEQVRGEQREVDAKAADAEIARMKSVSQPTSYADGRREAAEELALAIRHRKDNKDA